MLRRLVSAVAFDLTNEAEGHETSDRKPAVPLGQEIRSRVRIHRADPFPSSSWTEQGIEI